MPAFHDSRHLERIYLIYHLRNGEGVIEEAVHSVEIAAMEDVNEGGELRGKAMDRLTPRPPLFQRGGEGWIDLARLFAAESESDRCHRADRAIDAQ